MSQIPTRFRALFTKNQLTEMMSPTYAKLRNLDVNEAYVRLEDALRQLELVDGMQTALYHALRERRPKLDDDQLTDQMGKKLSRKKAWRPMVQRTITDGPMAALTILIDKGAGFSSGEAHDLLETREGQRMLQHGFEALATDLARQLAK